MRRLEVLIQFVPDMKLSYLQLTKGKKML